ncbi:LuxR C-terminal-related transcriptional regulator [Ferrimonas lipolytica]|uniref:HTH luxR-type domain-containing protein n=1 Tax=Ferrimonas lipolytica TaxID=2724191 RepID=A0A6H1UDV5_9GAMM|nr:LuxR C-terminal-related transcriptional regulator [Ferrimonas lipolytica]QIZ77261.1 hypothetical protein HER31_10450 [Ferrimonas lipolytica]
MNVSLGEVMILSNLLKSKLQRYEFLEAAFAIYPETGMSSFKNRPMSSQKAADKYVKYPIIGTSDTLRNNMVSIITCARKNKLAVASDVQKGKWPKGCTSLNSWFQFGTKDELYKKLTKSFGDNGFDGLFFVTIQEEGDDFLGVFAIASKCHNTENLIKKYEELSIDTDLELILYYFSRKYPAIINPTIRAGALGEKTIEIIRRTTEGMSLKQISDSMYLTERGVNYHLDQAKGLLKAKTKAELIYKAKEACII